MKKTQFGWVTVGAVLIVLVIILFTNKDIKTLLPAIIIICVVVVLFFNLTVTVSDKWVRFSFGIGIIRGKYSLDKIAACRPISYLPLGWGIRFRPGTILFNVSGNKAIELDIKNKKRKVWIGTDSPDELAAYINKKLKELQPSE